MVTAAAPLSLLCVNKTSQRLCSADCSENSYCTTNVRLVLCVRLVEPEVKVPVTVKL